MPIQIEDFTSNEEIDSFTAGDTTTELIGYVDAILGSKTVGGAVKKSLYKFIINNGNGRRVRILMWENTAAKYEQLIRLREIVEIKRAKSMPIDQRYSMPGDNVVPMELSVQRITSVDLHGLFEAASVPSIQVHRKISIEDIPDADGMIIVEGFIKVQICAAVVGNCSYDTGAITDGKFKLWVQVVQFSEDSRLTNGVHVQVKGEMKRDKYGTCYMQAPDMQAISVHDDATMSEEELKKGFRNPSSKRFLNATEDRENCNEKKSKTG